MVDRAMKDSLCCPLKMGWARSTAYREVFLVCVELFPPLSVP